MRRRTQLGVGFALVIVGLAAVALSLAEVRAAVLFKVAPRVARDQHLVRYRDASGSEVYLLGTIHSAHLDTAAYSLWHIAALLERLAPRRVVVESRAEELARGNRCDGPIEMGFASLLATHASIPSLGMDCWRRDAGLRRSDDERENEMFARAKPALHQPGATLILTGFSHVPELARRLEAEGYQSAPLEASTKTALFALDERAQPRAFPEGMAACLATRIAHDEQELAVASEAATREDLAGAIAVRRRFLAQVNAMGEAR